MSKTIYDMYNVAVKKVDKDKELESRLEHLFEECEEFKAGIRSIVADCVPNRKVAYSMALDEAADIFNVLFSFVQKHLAINSVEDFLQICLVKILKHDAFVSTEYRLGVD